MKIRCAVVTPYFLEDRGTLERCIESVKRQTIATDHIVVADGHPQDWIDGASVRHIRLDRGHNNFGNTPRSVGAMIAVGSGYDSIALLDADNWIDPVHCEYCMSLAMPRNETRYDFVIARRRFMRPDLSELPVPEEPLSQLVDTNCYFYLRRAFYTLPVWGLMPNELGVVCDRLVWHYMKSQALRAVRAERPTVNYLTLHADHYHMIGETPPPEATRVLDFGPAAAWIRSLPKSEIDRIAKLVGFRIDQFNYTPWEEYGRKRE